MKIPSPLTPRTDPSKQPLAYLDTSAPVGAFGAAIGQGLQNAGQGLETLGNKLMAEEKQRKEKVEDFDTARRLSMQNQEFNDEVEAIKKAAPPSGEGVREKINAAWEKRFFGFMSTVPERSKAEYAYKGQVLSNNWDTQGNSFERTASNTFFKTGVNDEASRAKTAVNQSPELYEAERARLFETIDKTGLSVIEKEELKRETERGLAAVHYKKMAADGTFTAMNTPVQGSVAVFVNRILNRESGGDPNAKNPRSTATGLGQFLEKTWVEQLRLARPDLTNGKADEELYALRLDPEISREVTTRYALDNANRLRSAGIAPTPGNIYLSHFLGPTGAQRVLSAKDAAPVETVVGSDAMNSNKAVFKNISTAGELKAWAKQQMGDGPLPSVAATKDADGYWKVPGIEYDLAGKTRAFPVSKEYVEKVIPAVQAVDPALTVKITSAGQEPGNGTGSHRHDVDSRGESGTADIVLMKNGKAIRPEEDKALYSKVIENLAAQGFTGIGHYGWGIHVGGGSRAKWGPDKSGATVDPVFAAAIDRGWARAADSGRDALDTDSRYRSLTFEDRVALRADGARQAQADSTAQMQEQEAVRKASANQLYTDLFDGKAGQADIDNARMKGILLGYEEISKAAGILTKKSTDQATLQEFLQKVQTPGAIFSPTNTDDKKGFNALFEETKGADRLAAMDREYFSGTMLPIVERTRDMPTEMVGTLTGMVRSRNQQQALFALDALGQLQRTSPRAYEDRVSAETQADVSRYMMLRNTMPAEELLRTINGGNTQEERQAAEIRRKDGERLLAAKDGKIPKIDGVLQEVLGQYGNFLGFGKPAIGASAPAAVGLERYANELWLTEYIKSGNVDAATKIVLDTVKVRYGVTEIGGGGKKLMELPPDKAGYKPLGGNFNYIDREVRELFKLKPEDKYELQTDEQTRQEFAAFQAGKLNRPPSYGLVTLGADGLARGAVLENGKPKRAWFQPKAAELQQEIDAFETRSKTIANREFFQDFERMKLLYSWGPNKMPQDMLDEFNIRTKEQAAIDAKKKQAEIDAFAAQAPRNGDPRAFELPLIEMDPSGNIVRGGGNAAR